MRFMLLASGLLLIIMGCSKNPASSSARPGPSGHDLFPMAIGNSWTYETTAYDSAGNVNGSSTATLTMPRDTVVASETWFFYAFHGTIFWRTRADGVWRMPVVQGVADSPVLYYKYPTIVGDTVTISDDGTTRQTMATLSLDSAAVTAAGAYRCVLYCQTAVSNNVLISQEYLYFAPGVGWTASDKYVIDLHGRRKISRIALTAYTVN
jgi:hypothetical protein